MPAKKTSAQLQREINEALARHKQSREKWLSLQAGPRYRERQAAYDEMTARAREARALEKRAHATKSKPAKGTIETRLPDAGAKETKKSVTVMKAFNSKVEKLLDRAGARLHHELKGESLDYRQFVLETKAGPIFVSPHGNWVAARFDDPEAAAKLVGTNNLNTYSGKWNHNYFAWPVDEALSDVARWLEKIAV